MIFETDQQTLNDLNILGKYKANSIYSLFCQTVTEGGEVLLEQMFMNPLTDAAKIEERVAEFRWFEQYGKEFPLDSEASGEVEHYLMTSGFKMLPKIYEACKFRMLELIGNDPALELWREQVTQVIRYLCQVKEYVNSLHPSVESTPLKKQVQEVRRTLNNENMSELFRYGEKKKMSLKQLVRSDRILLAFERGALQEVLEFVHRVDVDTVVGRVARERHFCFAETTDKNDINIQIEGVSHPCLTKAVSNNMEITPERNLFFLTGANMAGKSTLMKSFGIAVYMAHMGFPVAAKRMRFRVQQGMYTSINVSDNLSMGYSHFYAEVLRVKKVAIEVSLNKQLVVIFDELFKGTNVKDAYDATLLVAAALAERQNCSLLISTHIIEVAEELKKKRDNINYEYLPTVMKGSVPTYTYKLEPGVTRDKHGMIILKNERVVETILGENK